MTMSPSFSGLNVDGVLEVIRRWRDAGGDAVNVVTMGLGHRTAQAHIDFLAEVQQRPNRSRPCCATTSAIPRSIRASCRRACWSVPNRTWWCWKRRCACAWAGSAATSPRRARPGVGARAGRDDGSEPQRREVRQTHTQLSPDENGGTLVHYRTSITPGFWIPSVVGRRWMLRTLEDATATSS